MAHAYTVEKFLKVPTEWHPPRRDSEGNWIDPRDDLLPGCAIQCNTWLNEYNVCIQGSYPLAYSILGLCSQNFPTY